MCGISGIFTQQLHATHAKIVQTILTSQHQRGPDHQAITPIHETNYGLLLAHNRLSIIDLSSDANQPMWDSQQRYCISFNGEIYNYQELRFELKNLGHTFQTTSDTEVILAAFKQWGIAALDKFNGPFAFALFDKHSATLWLCRDRFGVKPLYYCWQQNTLYFASTTKALAQALGFKKNLHYVARGLRYRIYENDSASSPYENIKALLPGHALKIKASKELLQENLIKYYDLSVRVQQLTEQLSSNSTQQLLEQTYEQLNRAVTWRLRADVPVGISLSGGLDSASIAALAIQKQSLLAFSYGHPSIKTSEAILVDSLVKKLNSDIHYIAPTAAEFTTALLQTLHVQEAPFSSASVVAQYLVFQAAKQHNVKVLLGGQGGDEAFMGYRKFHWFYLQQHFRKKQYIAALGHFLQLTPTILAELSQAKLYWQQRQRYFSKQKYNSSVLLLPNVKPMQLQMGIDLQQRQIADVMQYSLPTLLRYEDRNSLGNSVESRLPFMDYQVVELGLALPAALKLQRGYGKWPIRAVMQGQIPDNILKARYKRGFDVSLTRLIDEGVGEFIRQALWENFSKIKPFLKTDITIAAYFSNQSLKRNSNAFAEAVTLLWLGQD